MTREIERVEMNIERNVVMGDIGCPPLCGDSVYMCIGEVCILWGVLGEVY